MLLTVHRRSEEYTDKIARWCLKNITNRGMEVSYVNDEFMKSIGGNEWSDMFQSFWCKMAMFHPNTPDEFYYVDLDTVLRGDFNDLWRE